MKLFVSAFTIALIIGASTAAVARPAPPRVSSDPTVLDAKSEAKARRIVEGREFQNAARSKDIARMNELLRGTGAVAANPVALFFCRPPASPVFVNGAWYCTGGGVSIKVHPFMYQ